MAGYIGSRASVVSSGAERKKTFAITTTTTVLTGLSYTPTFVHLFHNGVRLVDGTDYTATNGTSITLTSAAESGDEVVVISYASFQVADAYTKAETYSKAEADAEIAFKSFTEGANTGYGTAHRVNNPAYYGDIGSDALDLSYNAFASTTRGATGAKSTAIGGGVTASGDNSTAIGSNSEASGLRSTAIAYRALASGDNSVAAGYIATASGIGSFAQASRGNASGSYSANFGNRTYASGYTAFASGNGTTAAGDNSFVVGYNGGTGTASGTVFGVAYGNSTGDITASTTDTNLVLAVSNAGHVTMPYQPFFKARSQPNVNITTQGQILPFDVVDKNIGNHYNNSTFTFTAPVNGAYVFNVMLFTPPNLISFDYFYVNGVRQTSIEQNHAPTGYTNRSDVFVVYLVAGDAVSIVHWVGTTHLNGSFAGPHSYFSGYLLG
jgi:hypothetical protein